jgi:hypothetical protein
MKNSFKKLISLVLVLTISFAMAVPAFAAEKTNNNSIKDILRSEYLVSASSNRVEFSRTIPVSSVKSNNLTANGMTSVQSFAKENVTVVPENETAANEIKRLLSSGGSNYEYLTDISGTVEIL